MVSLSFAKLVATPTDTSWSQVYNAGNLFASLSLSKTETEEEVFLHSIGKEMFANLEAEFFTLEDKSLQSIKDAIANSTHIIPSGVSANLSLAYFKGNILYLFIYGAGTVTIKRGGKVGTLLEEKSTENTEIVSSSGFLEQNDTIVLQTPQFAKDMPMETISSALDLSLPNDIAEALSPAMHEKDDGSPRVEAGGQAAIIIEYKEASPQQEKQSSEIETPDKSFSEIEEIPNKEQTDIAEKSIHENLGEIEEITVEKDELDVIIAENISSTHSKKPSFFSRLRLSSIFTSFKPAFQGNKNTIQLNHRKKLFLSIAVIILILLVVSISLTKKKQDDSKTQALFNSVYTPAFADYEKGLGIESINKDFARSDFQKAQKKLTENKDKFKKGSTEEKQISELLSKVNSELGGTTSATKITPKAVTLSDADLLSVEKDNSGGIAYTVNKDSVDYLTEKAVVSVDKAGKTKDIIENDNDWEKGVGLAAYQGNIYILDTKNGVLKFTAGSDGFGQTSYLKEKPDLSNASSIAIDGSVWILLKDGNILKYTRGVSDGLKVKGLDKQMSGASRIFTNIDTENLYVLDPGNSRIVKFNKDGNFQTQYSADILKSAKDLEVSEKDGKILVLSNGKTWEIPL